MRSRLGALILALAAIVAVAVAAVAAPTVAEPAPRSDAARAAQGVAALPLAAIEARTRRILTFADRGDAASVRSFATPAISTFLLDRTWSVGPYDIDCRRSVASRPGDPVYACRIVGSAFPGNSAVRVEGRAYWLYLRHTSEGWTATARRLIGGESTRDLVAVEQRLTARRDRLFDLALAGRFDEMKAEASKAVIDDLRTYDQEVVDGRRPAVFGGCSRMVRSDRSSGEYACSWYVSGLGENLFAVVDKVRGRLIFSALYLNE